MTANGTEFKKPAIKADKKALNAGSVISKPKRGRPPLFNSKLYNRVIDLLYEGDELEDAIERQGITVRCWNKNLAKCPELVPEVKAAIAAGTKVLKLEGKRRALAGSDFLLKWFIQKGDPSWDDKPVSFVNTVVNNPAKVQEIDARLKQADEIGDRLLAQFEARKAIA